ncbi:hypothetical protein AB1Y20_015094 [Prymnesium parvum]|uniref:FHA domain-containing protein n=1 Tax=Prymnesium parvum TaxID=97485 RepID=A0AB34K0E5_PRYPA
MIVEGKGLAARRTRDPLVAVVNLEQLKKPSKHRAISRPLTCEQNAAAPVVEEVGNSVPAAEYEKKFYLKDLTSGASFVLEGSPVWIGRWKERSNVWLDDGGLRSKASRLHARLERDEETNCWTLIDNDSANGTFVNDHRVSSELLKAGDILGFGTCPKMTRDWAVCGGEAETMPCFHFEMMSMGNGIRPTRVGKDVTEPQCSQASGAEQAGLADPKHRLEEVRSNAGEEDAFQESEESAAFKAGEIRTMVSLLGCMRAQLRAAEQERDLALRERGEATRMLEEQSAKVDAALAASERLTARMGASDAERQVAAKVLVSELRAAEAEAPLEIQPRAEGSSAMPIVNASRAVASFHQETLGCDDVRSISARMHAAEERAALAEREVSRLVSVAEQAREACHALERSNADEKTRALELQEELELVLSRERQIAEELEAYRGAALSPGRTVVLRGGLAFAAEVDAAVQACKEEERTRYLEIIRSAEEAAQVAIASAQVEVEKACAAEVAKAEKVAEEAQLEAASAWAELDELKATAARAEALAIERVEAAEEAANVARAERIADAARAAEAEAALHALQMQLAATRLVIGGTHGQLDDATSRHVPTVHGLDGLESINDAGELWGCQQQSLLSTDHTEVPQAFSDLRTIQKEHAHARATAYRLEVELLRCQDELSAQVLIVQEAKAQTQAAVEAQKRIAEQLHAATVAAATAKDAAAAASMLVNSEAVARLAAESANGKSLHELRAELTEKVRLTEFPELNESFVHVAYT